MKGTTNCLTPLIQWKEQRNARC